MSEITQPARRIVLGAPPAYVQIEISALGPPAPGLSLRGKEEKKRAEQRGDRERGPIHPFLILLLSPTLSLRTGSHRVR